MVMVWKHVKGDAQPIFVPGNGVRRGFTLAEVLVAALIVAILVALALPMLSSVRDSGRDSVSLSNLRSHATIIDMYRTDWNDTFPAFMDPSSEFTTLVIQGHEFRMRYFEAHHLWQAVLADLYYDEKIMHRSVMRPGAGWSMSYFYSCSLIADPAYWSWETRQGPSQWRAVRGHEVAYPSKKAVLVEREPVTPYFPERYAGRPLNMGFVDGSARGTTEPGLVMPLRDGEGEYPGTRHTIGVYGLHTVGGARGRDVE
ncbi:MAG: type II secretion system GspH family protein [Phycisphaerales bacterium]|nr:type II secretion system GspH family protein [Phycisphaerales bacterium]